MFKDVVKITCVDGFEVVEVKYHSGFFLTSGSDQYCEQVRWSLPDQGINTSHEWDGSRLSVVPWGLELLVPLALSALSLPVDGELKCWDRAVFSRQLLGTRGYSSKDVPSLF